MQVYAAIHFVCVVTVAAWILLCWVVAWNKKENRATIGSAPKKRKKKKKIERKIDRKRRVVATQASTLTRLESVKSAFSKDADTLRELSLIDRTARL